MRSRFNASSRMRTRRPGAPWAVSAVWRPRTVPMPDRAWYCKTDASFTGPMAECSNRERQMEPQRRRGLRKLGRLSLRLCGSDVLPSPRTRPKCTTSLVDVVHTRHQNTITRSPSRCASPAARGSSNRLISGPSIGRERPFARTSHTGTVTARRRARRASAIPSGRPGCPPPRHADPHGPLHGFALIRTFAKGRAVQRIRERPVISRRGVGHPGPAGETLSPRRPPATRTSGRDTAASGGCCQAAAPRPRC